MTRIAAEHFEGARRALDRNDTKALFAHLVGLLREVMQPAQNESLGKTDTDVIRR